MSQRPLPAPAARPAFTPAFYLALATTLFFALGITVLLPIVPLFITQELGAEDRWLGTATLTITTVAVALRIPGGTLSDRQGRRRIMLIGASFGVLASVLYTAATTLPLFLAARALTGASLGFFGTASKALIADLAPPERRGEALGLSNAAFSLAIVVSPLLGEGLKNTLSFQAVFITSGLLTLLCLATTLALPHVLPTQSQRSALLGDLRQIARARGTWAANVMILGVGATMAVVFTFYPLLAERKALFATAPRLISPIAMALGLSIWALTGTLAEPLAGRLSDRFGRQIVAVPGLALAVTGLLALSRATDTASTYLAIAVLSLGWGATRTVADALAQDAVAPALRGVGAAVLYTSFDVAVGLNAQLLSTLLNGDDFSAFFRAATLVLVIFTLPGIALATRLRAQETAAILPGPVHPGAD